MRPPETSLFYLHAIALDYAATLGGAVFSHFDDFHCIRAARFAERLTDGQYDVVAVVDCTAL
jgi:hypothetical protein